MKLKAQYDNETDIPEQLRDYYVEKDGKWLCDGVEGAPTKENLDRQQAALKKEREARSAAESKLKAFVDVVGDDFDVETFGEAWEEREQLRAASEANGGDGKVDIGKIRADAETAAEKKFRREVEKAKADAAKEKARADAAEGTIRTTTVQQQISAAADKGGVVTKAKAGLARMIGSDFNLDDSGVARNANGQTVDEWLSDAKESGEYDYLFPVSAGGGANGGGNGKTPSKNPFTKDGFNLSAAMAMQKADPAKAEQNAKAAGFNSAKEAFVAAGKAAAGA